MCRGGRDRSTAKPERLWSFPDPVRLAVPSVSVVIPTYNRGQLLEQAIQSVLDQTYRDLELIVVDDGSTDDTRRRVVAVADDRVRYIHQRNAGLAGARNTGIREARGDYVAFLDDDDVWMAEKLERQMAIMQSRPNVAVVHCGFRFVDLEGNPVSMEYRRPPSRGSLYEDLMYANVISGSGSAAVVRARCFIDAGTFDPTLRAREDQDMWRRLALAGHEFACVDEALVDIRWHAANMQKDPRRMAEANMRYLDKLRLEVPAECRHHLRDVADDLYTTAAMALVDAGLTLQAVPFAARSAALGPARFFRIAAAVGRLAVWRSVQRAAHRLSGLRRALRNRPR